MIARRLVIRGRVQGVGYRYSMIDAAQGLGVVGWVRNLTDGNVEALIQGEPAQIDAILAWCGRGPPSARVSAVDATPVATDSAIVAFTHRRSE